HTRPGSVRVEHRRKSRARVPKSHIECRPWPAAWRCRRAPLTYGSLRESLEYTSFLLCRFHHPPASHRFHQKFKDLYMSHRFVDIFAPGIESVPANEKSVRGRLLGHERCRLV